MAKKKKGVAKLKAPSKKKLLSGAEALKISHEKVVSESKEIPVEAVKAKKSGFEIFFDHIRQNAEMKHKNFPLFLKLNYEKVGLKINQ